MSVDIQMQEQFDGIRNTASSYNFAIARQWTDIPVLLKNMRTNEKVSCNDLIGRNISVQLNLPSAFAECSNRNTFSNSR